MQGLLRDNAAHHTWDLPSDILAASDSILVTTDPGGIIVDARGNSELVDAPAREHVAPGYDWSETAS